MKSGASDTLQHLVGSSRNCIAYLYSLQVLTLQGRVFVAELAGCNHLTRFQVLRIAGVNNHFLAPDAVVFIHEFALVNNLLFEEASVTRIKDSYLTHHLTNDYFKVFVVDLHTLHTVNVLNFIHDIFLNGCRTLDVQDVGRSDSTIGQRCTGTHIVVFLYKDLF